MSGRSRNNGLARMNSVSFDYVSARVLVTGGTSGIGQAIACAYHDAGAMVTITGTRASPADYSENLAGLSYRRLDVEDKAAIDTLAASIDVLDILVHSAGVGLGPAEYEPDIFDRAVGMHLTSVYRLSQGCLDASSKSRMQARASIICIASLASYLAYQRLPGNSGVVATAGDLVFQGHADGQFVAYSARTGKEVWSYDAKAGISGSPISFSYRGVQYVSVVAGYGGGLAFLGEASARFGWDYRTQRQRLLVFRLGGVASLPTGGPNRAIPIADGWHPDPSKARIGAALFTTRCAFCHGYGAVAGGSAPDLRSSPIPVDGGSFATVVRDGALVPAGMPRFEEFSPDELLALRSYIRGEADKALAPAARSKE
jgi:mono/diheme cytochrome c family protein